MRAHIGIGIGIVYGSHALRSQQGSGMCAGPILFDNGRAEDHSVSIGHFQRAGHGIDNGNPTRLTNAMLADVRVWWQPGGVSCGVQVDCERQGVGVGFDTCCIAVATAAIGSAHPLCAAVQEERTGWHPALSVSVLPVYP